MRHPAVVATAIVTAVLTFDTGWAQDGSGAEAPFQGGVFSRQAGKAIQPTSFTVSRRSLAVFDNEGRSNRLVIRVKYDNPGMFVNVATLQSEGSRPDLERAVVVAVAGGDAVTRRALAGPIDANHLIEMDRLSADARSENSPDDPREVLEQYIVLTYPTVSAALSAQEILRQHPGIAYVGNDRRIDFSWAPPSGAADPYFAKKAGATNVGQYQWGLQAMNFPAAWNITKGHGYVGAVDGGLPYQSPNGAAAPLDLQNNFRLQFSRDPYEWDSWPEDFHGSHVLGIIAATEKNGIGVSGVCPTCSAMMARVDVSSSVIAAAYRRLVDRGVQIINYSMTAVNPSGPEYTCSSFNYQEICTAIAYASMRDVLIVAAAGNFSRSAPGFPANMPDVLSVAGAANTNINIPSSWTMWSSSVLAPDYGSNFGSDAAGLDGVVAPAKAIVSVVPDNPHSKSYVPDPPFYCSDYYPVDQSATGSTLALGHADGYASCTGTSMAAPHIAGLAGILRSVNPRLGLAAIKSAIQTAGDKANARLASYGYGLPNALTAVNKVLTQTPSSRLTPLFSFYSSGRLDYFYTTVPQMGTAAIYGTLEPKVTTATPYLPTGTAAITGYSAFPAHKAGVAAPRADVWIFTTPANPKNAAIPLVPLYRLSWKCSDWTPSPPTICSTNGNHVDVTYTADPDGILAFQDVGYRLDGIEGYIYPKTMSHQPTGTRKLMRKYNPARDDHAIFPDNMLATMQAQGYTEDSGSNWLGYVYPNLTGVIPTIQ